MLFPLYVACIKKKKRDAEKEFASEEEEGVEKEVDEIQGMVQAALRQDPLIKEIQNWRQQSPYLFLTWENAPIRRPGRVWIKFMKDVTGQSTHI